ncbi:MAG: gfo/Idh/MocA family oxidoreductase, partial [Clostridia bacterium]|nr:gfo/Idh/MocA family oxidoreductase [Clostridia bacterium]
TVGGEMTLYHDLAGVMMEEKIPILKDSSGKGLFYKKIRSFLDAIINNEPAPVPTSQILYNQAIIDGIYKSSEIGKEIEVEIPEI